MKKHVFILSLLASSVQAQIDHTTYNLSHVPQIQWLNPALQPTTKGYFASSAFFKVANTGFAPADILQRVSNDTLFFNATKFVNKLNRRNHIQANAFGEFGMGFRLLQKYYIQFGLNEKVVTNISIPKDIFEFAIFGNAHPDLIGKELNIGGFDINATHYRENFVGLSYAPNCNMSFGARVKLLRGLENIKTTNTKFSIRTDPNDYELYIKSNLQLNSSGLLDSTAESKYNDLNRFGKPNNTGLGIDLGATYTYKKINFSASLLDLGFITWRQNNISIRSRFPNQEFAFKGVDINTLDSNANIDDYLAKIADSLLTQFGVDTVYGSKYRTALTSRIYLGAQYQIGKFTFGGTLFSEFFNGGIRPGLALMARKDFGRWAQVQVNYSYMNRNLFNLGLGGSINAGPIQFFAMSDNVLGTLLFPLKTKVIQGRVGVNIGWWYGRDCNNPCNRFPEKCAQIALHKQEKKLKKQDIDNDGVYDFWDNCVNVPGLVSLNGCPDQDGDGLTDSADKCPSVFGVLNLQGCPDNDRDSIANDQDECPDQAGPASLNGCPDTDGDGVLDKDDNCIDQAGPLQNKGCPWGDADNDGLTENIDDCPNTPGPNQNKGCPWPDTDGDGLTDNIDKCPIDKGPKSNGGCPIIDSDGDGLADAKDNCPHTPGPISNNGCPVIEEKEQEIINQAFQNLEFETGKAVIRNSSYSSLVELANLLKKKSVKLLIAGHTDNVGSASANMLLSKERALAVQQFLIDNGVSPTQILSNWFGATMPIADNNTPEGRQLNRRVELKIVFD